MHSYFRPTTHQRITTIKTIKNNQLKTILFALINNVRNLLSTVLSWLGKHTATVTTIATVFLAVFTFLYLRVTQKVVWVQTSPKVFIKNVEATVTPDYDNNKLVVRSAIIFTNCGKTEAKNFVWSYIIKRDSQELVKKDEYQTPYVYPEQNYRTTITTFSVELPPEQMNKIKQAQELKTSTQIRTPIIPVFLDIEYEYDDPDGKRIPSRKEQYKCLLPGNKWVIPARKKD